MNYTFDPRKSAATQLGALGMTGGNMAGGQIPFDPSSGYAGGPVRFPGTIPQLVTPPGQNPGAGLVRGPEVGAFPFPTGPINPGQGGTAPRNFQIPGRGPKKPKKPIGRSVPGTTLPTVFNPGMLDPSKLGSGRGTQIQDASVAGMPRIEKY